MQEVNIFLAFGAGFLSFVSPCVLPLYPAFLSYITGMSVSELQDENKHLTRRSIFHTLIFLLGFSAIFIVLGFGTTLIADFFLIYQNLIRQIGAILIVFFGFVVLGIFNFDFLSKSRTITIKDRPAGYFGSFLIGMAFSMGWTPCTGPILVAVISLAASHPEQGMVLMISYVLGFAIPFLLLAIFIGRFKWIRKHNQLIMKIGGIIMILFGIALFFDWMTKLTSLLAKWTGFYGF